MIPSVVRVHGDGGGRQRRVRQIANELLVTAEQLDERIKSKRRYKPGESDLSWSEPQCRRDQRNPTTWKAKSPAINQKVPSINPNQLAHKKEQKKKTSFACVGLIVIGWGAWMLINAQED